MTSLNSIPASKSHKYWAQEADDLLKKDMEEKGMTRSKINVPGRSEKQRREQVSFSTHEVEVLTQLVSPYMGTSRIPWKEITEKFNEIIRKKNNLKDRSLSSLKNCFYKKNRNSFKKTSNQSPISVSPTSSIVGEKVDEVAHAISFKRKNVSNEPKKPKKLRKLSVSARNEDQSSLSFSSSASSSSSSFSFPSTSSSSSSSAWTKQEDETLLAQVKKMGEKIKWNNLVVYTPGGEKRTIHLCRKRYFELQPGLSTKPLSDYENQVLIKLTSDYRFNNRYLWKRIASAFNDTIYPDKKTFRTDSFLRDCFFKFHPIDKLKKKADAVWTEELQASNSVRNEHKSPPSSFSSSSSSIEFDEASHRLQQRKKRAHSIFTPEEDEKLIKQLSEGIPISKLTLPEKNSQQCRNRCSLLRLKIQKTSPLEREKLFSSSAIFALQPGKTKERRKWWSDLSGIKKIPQAPKESVPPVKEKSVHERTNKSGELVLQKYSSAEEQTEGIFSSFFSEFDGALPVTPLPPLFLPDTFERDWGSFLL